ncbi:MAG: transketolase [Janthinobacterium lividum]
MLKISQNINEIQRLNFLEMATALRVLSMDSVEKAKSGHPGMPMGMADVAVVLYSSFLKFSAQNPEWSNRDRFILSAGHGSILLYALNYLTGYAGMTLNELQNFRQLNSHTAGHPEVNHALGIETTTGPLGQGLGNAVGMALAEQRLRTEFGQDLINHRTYAIAGDGCLMEGISHEVMSLAGHLKLANLTVLFDDNQISIDGPTNLAVSDDQLMRFESYGWHTCRIDGHNYQEIEQALQAAQDHTDRPSFIACRTRIGQGSPNRGGTSAIHGSALGADEIKATRDFLKWPHAPFDIPESILNQWRQVGQQHQDLYQAYDENLSKSPQKNEFERRLKGDLKSGWQEVLNNYRKKVWQEKPKTATRQSSGDTLDILTDCLPELWGGSADLTGSNNTKSKRMRAYSSEDLEGHYLHYGVREHGMAAIMNGIALHGGYIPYGGTFLVFSDYCRPAIRLSALMHQRVIYVLTHDSIGLGEDGPTHQPVEHLAALRAIPNLNVFRPCDAIEVIECWQLALENSTTPSVLALTRQNLPTLRESELTENLSARGGYILKPAVGDHRVTLLATGSEVEIMCQSRDQLQSQGISTSVVSLPCMRLFDQQSQEYRQDVLKESTIRIACEAAISQGWDRYIGSPENFVGMTGFGASAPYQDLYQHFNITSEAVVAKVMQKI